MFESQHEFVEEVLKPWTRDNLEIFFPRVQLITRPKKKRNEIAHMVGMIVGEKYAVNFVVGDSQVEELFQVSITKINECVDFVVLNKNPGRIALQRGYGGSRSQYCNLHLLVRGFNGIQNRCFQAAPTGFGFFRDGNEICH